jgi:hypothetical protein
MQKPAQSSTTLVLAAFALMAVMAAPAAAQQDARDVLGATSLPFVRLLDTGTSSHAALGERAPDARWRVLAEGQTAHEFAGDAVLLNNRIALLLPTGGRAAELYAKTPSGLKRRATVAPAGAGLTLTATRVVENQLSGATIEAVFAPAAVVRFRLTTGQAILTALPGPGMDRLNIAAGAPYVLVSDFFADDALYAAGKLAGERVGLPLENSFLALLEGADSLLMCIWRSNQRAVDVAFAPAGRGPSASCRVACATGEEVWLALLEAPGIWHARSLASAEPDDGLILDWRPPFPARWRASFADGRGKAVSRDFEARGEGAALEEPRRSRSAEGGTSVRPPPADDLNADVVVLYPLDRTRATPLTAFCPIDVMRNTLGVGPCQYVLAAEGLDAEADPTPAEVTQWVERLFRRKRAERQADAVRERLAQMAAHVGHLLERIEEYDALAADVEERCAEATAGGEVEQLCNIARELRRAIERGRQAMGTPAAAAALAEALAALIGREDAYARSQPIGEELRAIGAAQDATLARCRMAARRMREIARMAEAREPAAAAAIAEVWTGAEEVLHGARGH